MAGTINLFSSKWSASSIQSRISDGSCSAAGGLMISLPKVPSTDFKLKSSRNRKPQLMCFAGKSPEDFTEKGEDKGEFVAPRVTPDYVGKDSIKPPPRITKSLEGGSITRWGGNVRGGKYQMGQGTDRVLDIFGNGNAMLIAAGGLIALFFVLLQFRPDAPPPPPAI